MELEINYFYSLTPAQFKNISEGRQSRLEWLEQNAWERARWLGIMILQPHTKKHRTIKPHDIAVFPWEKKEEKKLTPSSNEDDFINMLKSMQKKK